MKIYLTKEKASRIVSEFQWLIGQEFNSPYGWLSIDMVEAKPVKHDPSKYHVIVSHDAFKKGSIPEFFGFKNPSSELIDFLNTRMNFTVVRYKMSTIWKDIIA